MITDFEFKTYRNCGRDFDVKFKRLENREEKKSQQQQHLYAIRSTSILWLWKCRNGKDLI